jgi:hypothetical protein
MSSSQQLYTSYLFAKLHTLHSTLYLTRDARLYDSTLPSKQPPQQLLIVLRLSSARWRW